ncbi:hypothetical protein CSPX01_12773 [Colletotrichum filicis]|nr:hypothetical protein CSPX01_12773 [Colletotrichum filicis]
MEGFLDGAASASGCMRGSSSNAGRRHSKNTCSGSLAIALGEAPSPWPIVMPPGSDVSCSPLIQMIFNVAGLRSSTVSTRSLNSLFCILAVPKCLLLRKSTRPRWYRPGRLALQAWIPAMSHLVSGTLNSIES